LFSQSGSPLEGLIRSRRPNSVTTKRLAAWPKQVADEQARARSRESECGSSMLSAPIGLRHDRPNLPVFCRPQAVVVGPTLMRPADHDPRLRELFR
jgi:hypothetical protein